MFYLSDKSLANLEGVNPALVRVVQRAIQITRIDFGVVEGVRSYERQQLLVKTGASRTMASKHLTGMAVDLMAYLDGRASWEVALYDDIADAMRTAAVQTATPIRWGGAWNIPDIRSWTGTMEQAMNWYIDKYRKLGRRPFIDGPHFEMI